ncbi:MULTISPECIES: TonB-dependent siderophore receptor [unclassified Oceanobacter]|uniref:TonB-dependent receptor plug domain-containing protein n=1 Tax=unclassified Oceanobacter TaxID=2620260 RepID=UPI0027329E97|nr:MULTISPECIES: TonB-dependent receptor [unclassified Oceanobacter]MDP2608599.1 TonB-dependent receptor [Oceanobacter sp. 1_MG-2023]MDP2611639.1 TonB-dependent receptor [Oceanobacter sp. 2_MG-2023]
MTYTPVVIAEDVAAETPLQEDADVFYLDTLVVTAARGQRPLADTPVRTLILDETTIQRLHTRDIRDALRVIPGVQMREIHGKTGESIQVQGLDGERVLILVDGMPVSATTGSMVDLSQLSALDIDHIEMIPGAASTLYGSAAMGGVVNIITRDMTGETRYRLAMDAGSYGEERELSDELLPQRHYLATADLALSSHRQLSLSADQRKSSDIDLYDDSWSSNGFDGTKTTLAASWQERWGSAGPGAVDGHATIRLEQYKEDLVNRQLTSSNQEGTKEEQLERWRLAANVDQALLAGRLSASVLYEQQTDDTAQLVVDDAILAGNLWRSADYSQYKLMTQWQAPQWTLGSTSLQMVTGLEHFGEQMEQQKQEIKLSCSGVGSTSTTTTLDSGYCLVDTVEVPNETRHSVEAFMQGTLTQQYSGSQQGAGLVELELSPGLRWQNDSDFGGYLSPALASRQKWQWSLGKGDWQIQTRQSIGMGYRVPNLKNRYYVFDHSVNGYKVLGDEDLQPEQSRSVQLSATITDGKRLHLEVSAYHNQITDLIEAVSTGETEQSGTVVIYRYSNIASAMTRGADVAVQWQFSPRFQQRLSYSLLDARDLELGVALTERSRHHAKGLWMWDVSDTVDLTLISEYVGSSYTEVEDEDSGTENQMSAGYWQWDIKGNWQFNPALRWYAGVNNLTDSVRDPSDSYDRRPTEGRFPYAGFELTF